jgi:WhiB family transcriptional regulator, redox-sensing transcriptional regulator
MSALGDLDPKTLDLFRRAFAAPSLRALVDPRLSGAACVGKAPLFDDRLDLGDHESESDEERDARHREARKICRCCPVRPPCGTAAGEHESAGIWAGYLERGP